MNRIEKSDQIRIANIENEEDVFIAKSKNGKEMIENCLRDFINGLKS